MRPSVTMTSVQWSMIGTATVRVGGMLAAFAICRAATAAALRHGAVVVCNGGIAFGMPIPSSAVTVVSAVLIALVGVVAMRTIDRGTAVAAILLAAGGASNFIDRFRFGCVIDYVPVPHLWAFNVADACITVGAVLLLTRILRRHD